MSVFARAFRDLMVLTWAAVFAPEVVHGAEIDSEMIDGEMAVITLTGDIQPGDAIKFRNEAAKYESAIVWLESDGGVTTEAIEIGETIRLKGFGTLVINGENCFSACGLIWLAGSPRAITKSAQVGFHATWVEADGRLSESGVGNALVGRYFTLLNLPAKAVVFATSAPPNSLNWLNRVNYSDLGIDATVLDDFNEREQEEPEYKPVPKLPSPVTTLPPGNSKESETTFYDDVGPWSISIDNTLSGSCYVSAEYESGTVLRIGLDFQGQEMSYLTISNPRWTSLVVGEEFDLKFSFSGFAPWTVSTYARVLGEEIVLAANFTSEKFWDEFVAAESLRISRDTQLVGIFSLEGSAAAFSRMIDCQRTANSSTPDDPFAD